MKKIFGYYHVWAVHSFDQIVKEQIKCLVDSGLYDAMDTLYIGCLGEYEKFLYLQELIKKYPKIKIAVYDSDPTVYEFVTLNVLKEHADKAVEDYYMFYLHVKAVSFPKHINEVAFNGGAKWRESMNYWTLTRWKDNVKALDDGYEVCGTQLRTREFPKHFSGNFFWMKTEYAKLLPPAYSLDMTNRMVAEFFSCMADPIVYSFDQTYIDYYTSAEEKVKYPKYGNRQFPPEHPLSKFEKWQPKNDQQAVPKPLAAPQLKSASKQSKTVPTLSQQIAQKAKSQPVKKRSRNIVHTLCYAPYNEVERAVESLYELNDKNDFVHCIVDREFPLLHHDTIPHDIEKQKKENTEFFKELANKHGSKYLKFIGGGVSQSWSFVAQSMEVDSGDVLISCDPDEVCKNEDWVRSLAVPLRSDKKFGASALIMQEQIPTLNNDNSKLLTIDGLRLLEVEGGAMWATCAISGDVIKAIGGIPYPESLNLYGGLEGAVDSMMKPHGYKWCFLLDYLVEHPDWDFSHYLRQWKHFVLSQNAQEQMPFEMFLNKRRAGSISDEMIKKLAQ